MNFTQYFETATRPNGNTFTRNTDNCPEHIKEFIHFVHDHFDAMPNDWIYETIYNAFEYLEHNTIDDVNIEPSVYNSTLIEWLHNPFAINCIDEYRQEIGFNEKDDFITQISRGQWLAMDIIYRLVSDFIDDQERHADADTNENEKNLVNEKTLEE